MGYLTRMLIEKKWRENGRKDALRLARQPCPEGVAVETGLAKPSIRLWNTPFGQGNQGSFLTMPGFCKN